METTITYQTNTKEGIVEQEISREEFEKAIFYLLTDVNSDMSRSVSKSEDGMTEHTYMRFAKADGSRFFEFRITKKR